MRLRKFVYFKITGYFQMRLWGIGEEGTSQSWPSIGLPSFPFLIPTLNPPRPPSSPFYPGWALEGRQCQRPWPQRTDFLRHSAVPSPAQPLTWNGVFSCLFPSGSSFAPLMMFRTSFCSGWAKQRGECLLSHSRSQLWARWHRPGLHWLSQGLALIPSSTIQGSWVCWGAPREAWGFQPDPDPACPPWGLRTCWPPKGWSPRGSLDTVGASTTSLLGLAKVQLFCLLSLRREKTHSTSL